MNTTTDRSGAACDQATGMTVEKIVHIFAGTVILISLALGAPGSPLFHSVNWLWVTTFVGANLLQSGFTGLCPLNTILHRVFHVRREADVSRGR